MRLISLDAAAVAAIGTNPLDPAHREPRPEAGTARAAAELDALAAIWF